MRLLDWLLGEPSGENSLEARREYEVNKDVDERRRQARDRRITQKAIEVLLGFGECNNKSYIVDYKYKYHSCPCGEMSISGSIYQLTDNIYYPHDTDDSCSSDLKGRIEKTGFGIEIEIKGLTVYQDQGKCEKSYSCFFSSIFPILNIFNNSKTLELSDILEYNSLDSITTYKSGDWETHLDELYHRIPQAKVEKAEKLTRQQEEKLRKEREDKEQKTNEEQERKRKEIEDKKKRFGL